MTMGDPYEGKVISWITDRITRIITDNVYIIDTIFADLYSRIIAIMKNRNFAIPDIKITATGKTGLPSISEADVITENMYVPIPYIAIV